MEKSGEAYGKVVSFSSLEELKKEQETQSRYLGHHSNCLSLEFMSETLLHKPALLGILKWMLKRSRPGKLAEG
jgi:hypothetical protein